jgi:GNAT superfamily N-acetyltransferase
VNNLSSEFELSTDKARLDIERIEAFIRTTYWAAERPRELIERSVENSLCVGAYRTQDGEQVGFARLVTDYVDFGWVTDVMVHEDYRGRGLGQAMVETLTTLPGFETVRFVLATRDAHGVYEKVGFVPLPNADRWMMRERQIKD